MYICHTYLYNIFVLIVEMSGCNIPILVTWSDQILIGVCLTLYDK